MLTLKEISEGFYKNSGATQATFYYQIIEYLNNLSGTAGNTSSSIGRLIRDIQDLSTTHNNSEIDYIPISYSASYIDFVLSPETVDKNIKSIPDWFRFRNARGENIFTVSNNKSIDSKLSIIIKDLPNLESLEGLPESFYYLRIYNCPKIESKHLSAVKRLGVLDFYANLEKTYSYKDIFKYIKKIDTDINTYREQGAALKKLTDLKASEKDTVKNTVKNTIETKPKGSLSFPDVARANEEGKVMSRFKPVPVDNPDDAPTWYCRQSDFTISDAEGNIIGFTTKKFTVIYRKGLKIMKFDLGKRYALDLHSDNLIAKIVLS